MFIIVYTCLNNFLFQKKPEKEIIARKKPLKKQNSINLKQYRISGTRARCTT
ncbi:MAG: hypothetical protein U9Q69_01905 [Nanoarchaeota archaeon]|nr:hypothetical protein [Nanoarchaeota archaeon]